MKQYMLQWQTTTGGLPWEHRFEIHSDKMAQEYTVRSLKYLGDIRCLMSIILWRLGETDGDAEAIGRYSIETIVHSHIV